MKRTFACGAPRRLAGCEEGPLLLIDLADRRPQALTHELAEQADVVVTMGCGDECPYIPGKRYIDWDLQDPAGLPLDEVRAIRDDIARRVNELVLELDQQGPDA